MGKNETNISYKEEEETANETFYGHYYNRNPHFSVQRGKGHKNATRSTDKNVNTIAPQGKTTKCFICGCKFHWVHDCPYTEDNRHKKENSDDTDYLLISNRVLMSQQKREASTHTFLGETLGSAILDSGATGTLWIEMVKKTIEDTHCSFEVALAWAISAKNTLHSVHGYSPNQLVFGRNPYLPGLLNDKLLALEGVSTSEVVADNLNAMHAARKQFIASESSEKLRRTLHHQVRTSIS